jgi:hypothetical protein
LREGKKEEKVGREGKEKWERERGGRNDIYYIYAGSQWRAADLDRTFKTG